MEPMGLWTKLLLGAVAVMVILWMGPGVKRALQASEQAENKDWKGFLIPIGAVIVFVILLIVAARH